VGALLVACGQKSPPIAPELVRPRAPSALTASPTVEGVRLVWRRPETYTGGKRMNDLARFVIERAPGEGPAAFVRVGELELDDRLRFRKERRLEWTDREATAGQSYLYRVTAVTLDGYRSKPAGPVAIRFEPTAEPKAEPKKETP
jgi:hypothetical protein